MQIIEANGYFRHLNLVQSDPEFLCQLSSPKFVIPTSEIVDFDSWPTDIKIKDQNGKGACNGHAAALSLEYARVMNGQPHVPLSAWYIYSILCNGVDQGSSISDAFKLVQEGCAPEADVEYGLINPRKLDAKAKTNAVNYKMTVGAVLKTWPEIVSSVAQGKALNISICVGRTFNNIDDEGVPGVGRGPGNHAVGVMGGIKTSKKWGRLVKMPNSWGTGWGQKGFCWLSQAHIEGGSWFEAYEVEQLIEDLTDNDNPIQVV